MRRTLLGLLCVFVCVGVAAGAGRSALQARAAAVRAQASWEQLADAASRVRQAQATSPSFDEPVGDAQTAMIAKVSTALTRAGVPVARMTSLSPAGASPVGDTVRLSDHSTVRRVRRSASVTLDPVSLPDLGAFLSAWRGEQPQWRVSSLQLTPVPIKPSELSGTKSLPGNVLARPLTVHLTLESTTLERQ